VLRSKKFSNRALFCKDKGEVIVMMHAKIEVSGRKGADN
jgi:hypothetical protein